MDIYITHARRVQDLEGARGEEGITRVRIRKQFFLRRKVHAVEARIRHRGGRNTKVYFLGPRSHDEPVDGGCSGGVSSRLLPVNYYQQS